jgi:hypothetical protein
MTDSNIASDVDAVKAIVTALEPLDRPARDRVLSAVLALLGSAPVVAPAGAPTVEVSPAEATPARVTDIRTLREEKQPRSANEMAALAAYYLANLAPPSDKSETVGSADMERLFKQGGYPLPKKLNMLLPNATAAGYFDQAGRARYRLNPVGHNLVAHALPAGSGVARSTQAGSSRRTTRISPAAKRNSRSTKRKPTTRRK